MGFWDFLVSGGKSANYGSNNADPQASSGDLLTRISMANAGVDGYLPGFGPQVPAGNVGYVTNAVPGSVFDTGFPAWQITQLDNELQKYVYSGAAAARSTTDLNVWPFTLPDLDVTPIKNKVEALWTSWTGSLNKPPAAVDQVQPKGAPDLKGVVVAGLIGTAALAMFAMTRKA